MIQKPQPVRARTVMNTSANAFRNIMREPRFRNIPKVIETPKGRDMAEDVVNLAPLTVAERGLGGTIPPVHLEKGMVFLEPGVSGNVC